MLRLCRGRGARRGHGIFTLAWMNQLMSDFAWKWARGTDSTHRTLVINAVLCTALLGAWSAATQTTLPSPHVGAMGASERSITLCEVVANPAAYDGSDVEMRARYVSDGRHEEVLEDPTCRQGRRIIDIGKRGDSESVKSFYAERKRVCSKRGASYLCNTLAEVDVVGTINVMSGEFVLDIKEVDNFKFID